MIRTLSIGTLLLLLLAPFARAQQLPSLILTGLERELTLTLTPEYPQPNEAVQLSIKTFALDLNRSLVVWYADDAEIARGIGRTEASVTAKGAGEETHVVVIAQDESGITASAEAFIRPAEIDILWESLSYVPPFYEGRPLPGINGQLRTHALVRFERPDGTLVPDSDIIYTWYRDTTVVAEGRGKSTAVFPGPKPLGSSTIRVVAQSADRTYSGEASVRITSRDALALIYENHPLFGILFHRALEGSVNTLETEQKVTAVPYFAEITSPQERGLSYEWRVNGSLIAPDTREPQTLTITSEGYTGPASVGVEIVSASNYLLDATKAIQLIFGERNLSFFSSLNPFGSGE